MIVSALSPKKTVSVPIGSWWGRRGAPLQKLTGFFKPFQINV